MGIYEHEVDITKNIMKIDCLKSELLSGTAGVFKLMAKGINSELNSTMADELSNIILMCYFLGRRIGIDYKEIDKLIEGKISLSTSQHMGKGLYADDITEFAGYLKKSE